jgi:hypothetical protein
VPLTRRPELHRIVCAALGIVAGTSAMAVAKWVQSGVTAPAWLLNYLWPTGVGKFPLVPWAAFPLIGVWVGPAVFSETATWRQSLRAALAGVVFIVTPKFMASQISYDAPFVFERMGWILMGLAGCCWLHAAPRGTKWILEFGQLSLWSYTVHLVIVYGSCASFGLDALKPRYSPLVTAFALAVVLGITAVVVRWRSKNLQRRAAVRKMPAR